MINFASFKETSITSQGYPDNSRLLDYSSSVDGTTDWAVLLPPREKACKIWIISIHGHGANGRQLFLRADVKRHWLGDFQASGFGLLTPNLRGSTWMNPATVIDLDAMLNYLRTCYGAAKFIFYGGSMGGTASLAYATLRPENVAALALLGATCDFPNYLQFCQNNRESTPILGEIYDTILQCYGGTADQQKDLYHRHSAIYHVDALKDKPIYLCHGELDQLMPVEQSRQIATLLQDFPLFIYHEIAGGGHDAPLTYGQIASEECSFNILQWLTAHI